MKSPQELTGIWMSGVIGGAAALITTQPVFAAAQVTAVQLNPTASGLNIALQTQGSDRPQVFSVNRGNTWTADIINSHLQIPQGTFKQANPAAGIAMITVAPLDRNSVRVTVVGQGSAPTAQVSRSNDGKLIFSLTQAHASRATAVTAKPSVVPPPHTTSAARSTQAAPLPALPPSAVSQSALPTDPQPQAQPVPQQIAQNAPSPLPAFQGTPLVPQPEIKLDGDVYKPPAPFPPNVPFPLPRAVAPPTGDIAVGQLDASPTTVDLGTAQTIPRLVLRDASSREVLSLLGRSAGLNVIFTGDDPKAQQPQQPGQIATNDGPKVTLDIENEPIQNVFNYVLQITGLEANRRGNTVFVGPRLPNSARSVVVRSLRLNQVPITNALNFLVSLGAESAVARERQVVSVSAIPVTQLSGSTSSAVTQSQTTTEQRIETNRVDFKDSTPILRGLQVSGDERTGTVTIIGEPRKVDLAIAQLSQLDIRRRQVAVNVRVIDVNLAALDLFSSSFSFGVNDTRAVNDAGIALVNVGSGAPATTGLSAGLSSNNIGSSVSGIATAPFNFARKFFLQLQAAVTNQSAKVLTDPTLVVQEGQTATVRLTQEVVTNIKQQITSSTNSTTVTFEVEKASAGLILPVKVDKIDDNGFISLSVAPSIAAPDSTQSIAISGNNVAITLLNERRVESGQVRLRDGQTLVLSGIIQDQDRTTITKVPILGDIPILGALFRSTQRQNQRREVIVLVTPRILDDSDRSAFGYSYSPGPEIRKVLEATPR